MHPGQGQNMRCSALSEGIRGLNVQSAFITGYQCGGNGIGPGILKLNFSKRIFNEFAESADWSEGMFCIRKDRCDRLAAKNATA